MRRINVKYKQVKIDTCYILKPRKESFMDKIMRPFRKHKSKKELIKIFNQYHK